MNEKEREQFEAMRQLIRDLEWTWVETATVEGYHCSNCRNFRSEDHKSDCKRGQKIAAALAADASETPVTREAVIEWTYQRLLEWFGPLFQSDDKKPFGPRFYRTVATNLVDKMPNGESLARSGGREIIVRELSI